MKLLRSFTRALRRGSQMLCAVAICCQFLVPTGYMPGSVANGTAFVFCSMFGPAPQHRGGYDDVSGQAAADIAGMHMPGEHPPATAAERSAQDAAPGRHEHDHPGSDAWEHCPLGALGAGAALAFTIEPALEPAAPDEISTDQSPLRLAIAIVHARARAPPEAATTRIA